MEHPLTLETGKMKTRWGKKKQLLDNHKLNQPRKFTLNRHTPTLGFSGDEIWMWKQRFSDRDQRLQLWGAHSSPGCQVWRLCLPQATLPPQALPHRGAHQRQPGWEIQQALLQWTQNCGMVPSWVEREIQAHLWWALHTQGAQSLESALCKGWELCVPTAVCVRTRLQAPSARGQGVSAQIQSSHPITLVLKSAARQRQPKLYPHHNYWEA